MKEALREARRALARGDRPVGAVLVRAGTIVARSASRAVLEHDRLRHAEMEVLHVAAALLLQESVEWTLYSTLEPCVMCLGAIAAAGVQRVVFGLEDRWAGATRLLATHPYLQGHIAEVRGGVLRQESLEIYRRFSMPELQLVLTGHRTTADDALGELRAASSAHALDQMRRVGIQCRDALGVPMSAIHEIAARILPRHGLALELWQTGIHEARLLAALIDKAPAVTPAQMEAWARDFDSWDVCDTVCGSLFDRTPYAVEIARKWSRREETFVRRAGFALMASLATHDTVSADDTFLSFLSSIEHAASDERSLVRTARSWALRQIGKRNLLLWSSAIDCAHRMMSSSEKTARRVATDALRDLTRPTIRARLEHRERRVAASCRDVSCSYPSGRTARRAVTHR